MRCVVAIVTALAVTGCTPAAEQPAAETAKVETALPTGFPQADLAARGAECVVFLGLSIHAKTTPSGRDAPIMQQASDQWRAALQIDQGLSEPEAQQLVASTVNMLTATPAAQRDAASAWCVDNAPEPDPSK